MQQGIDNETSIDKEKEKEFLLEIMEEDIDEKDIEIYQMLRDNGRTTDTELAENLDMSITTARRRRQRLEDEGYLYIIALLFFHRANVAYADATVEINSNKSAEELDDFIEECVNNIRIYEVTKYMGKKALLLRFFERSMEKVNQYANEFLMDRDIVSDFELTPAIGSPKAWDRITNYYSEE